MSTIEKGLEGISCVLAKIIRRLASSIGDLLLQLIDKYINGPLCLIEEFLTNLLNKILEPLFAAIKTALDLINAALSIVGGVIGTITNILDFVSGILEFFKCDDEKKCPTQDTINLSGSGSQNGFWGLDPNFKLDINIFKLD